MATETKDEAPTAPEVNLKVASSPKEIQNALYARCASSPKESHIFSQQDLLSFGIVPNNDVGQLLVHTKQLTKDGLFKLMAHEGKAHWRLVKKDDAAIYKTLIADEALILSYIESSGRQGIWTKALRVRTNLHMVTVNRAIKALEGRNLIKSIKSMKFPTRKTYILAKLQPSEDVTGGPFYTDGTLDTEFIHQMSWWTERYVIGRSWYHPPTETKRKANPNMTQEQIEELRAEELSRRGPGRDRNRHMLPFPPSYNKYPTISEITQAINASELSGVEMKISEMQQLVDVLCWDGRLEKLDGGKSYRGTSSTTPGINGFTEAPCGRCPVFDFCEDGGPVNAASCKYFQDWLQF